MFQLILVVQKYVSDVLLFQVFKTKKSFALGLVESGLIRINDSLKKQGLNPIKIDATEMTFRVGFERGLKGTGSLKSSLKSSEQILNLIKNNPEITIVEMSTTIGISERGIKKQIAKLRRDGILFRKGSKKVGEWSIIY